MSKGVSKHWVLPARLKVSSPTMLSSTWWGRVGVGGGEGVIYCSMYVQLGTLIVVVSRTKLGGLGGRVDNQSSRREVECCFPFLDRLTLMDVYNGLGFCEKEVWLVCSAALRQYRHFFANMEIIKGIWNRCPHSMRCHGHHKLCYVGGVGDSLEFEGHVSMIEKYESMKMGR